MADFNQAIRLDPGYAPAYNNRSLVYKAQRQYDKAIADCDKAIQLRPNYMEGYRNRGMMYFIVHEPRKALADLEKSVELGGTIDQNYQTVAREARLQLAIPPRDVKKVNDLTSEAIEKAQKNDLKGAFKKFSEVIRLAPNYPGGHNNRGNVRRFQKDFRGAIEDYDQALRLDPGHFEAYFGRGLTYAEQNNPDYRKAIADFSAVIELHPPYLVALRMRGMARQKLGDIEGAWADLAKYVESGGARQQGEHDRMQKYVEDLARMLRPGGTS
jgi:tetratricopeptide (TPR) repeat protein